VNYSLSAQSHASSPAVLKAVKDNKFQNFLFLILFASFWCTIFCTITY